MNGQSGIFLKIPKPMMTAIIYHAPRVLIFKLNGNGFFRVQLSTSIPSPTDATGSNIMHTGLKRNASPKRPCSVAWAARVIPQLGQFSPVKS